MADILAELASKLSDEVVFVRLREDLPIERSSGSGPRRFVLPAGLPLPLTSLGAQALLEDDRVFPLPALVQGLIFVFEREEVLGSGLEPLPVYRSFARTMAEEVVRKAEEELREAVGREDWGRARARAVFLLNALEPEGGPREARLWTVLGLASARLGDLAKAEAWLRRGLSLDPDAAEAHAELGTCLGRLGRYEESRKELEKALELRPGDAALLFNLAQTCRRLGRLADARRFASDAKKADPGDARIRSLFEELSR